MSQIEGHSLLQFVRHCADNYLLSEHKSIRLEAVKTCSSLLKGTIDVFELHKIDSNQLHSVLRSIKEHGPNCYTLLRHITISDSA